MFSCVDVQLCPTLCDPMDCSMPGFPVLHHLPEFGQTHVCWVGDAIQPCCLSSCPESFPASGSFPISQLFTSDSQSIGASASVLPVNIPGWFPLGLTSLISLLSKGFSSLLQHHSLKASIILLCCPSTKTPVWGAVTLTLDQKIALCVHPTRKGIISPPVSFALPIPGVWETQLFF